MSNLSDFINIDKVTSYGEIIKELTMLKETLQENEMRQFLVFNDAYLVITSNIKLASEAGHFENPIFIERLSVCFAHYYFRAINQTSQNTELPYAWKALNQASRKSTTPNFILLLLGANAHINRDLPLALVKVMATEDSDKLLQDIVRIDKILMKSGREIIPTFSESRKSLDFLKRRVIFIYYRPTMYMVLFWRVRTWAAYKSINKHGLEHSGYADGSIKIANRLLLLGKYLG